METIALLPGVCSVCGKAIEPGHQVRYGGHRPVRHADCADPWPDPPTPVPESVPGSVPEPATPHVESAPSGGVKVWDGSTFVNAGLSVTQAMSLLTTIADADPSLFGGGTSGGGGGGSEY